MDKRLHYFDFHGIAEGVRYLLHYGHEKFEDIRYPYESWPDKTVKESLPYGMLPLYEEGQKKLTQSLAIARYLGTKYHLIPTDAWDQAFLDSIALTIYDFWQRVVAYIKETDPAKKQMLKKELLDEHVHYFFSRFEKELKERNGYFGGKLTWVDFVFVGIIEATNYFLETRIEKNYPTVIALTKKVWELRGVKEYLAHRTKNLKY